MKYSIIVPVYNSESVISDTLDRLLDYPNLDYEVIAVNDGSTDNTLAVLTQKQLTHKKLKVINQDNMGPSGARNTGLQSATGEWILFVDADDQLDTEIFDFLENYDESFDLLIFNYIIATEKKISPKKLVYDYKDSHLSADDILKIYLDGLLNSSCNKVYRRSIITNQQLSFDPALRMGEDLLFNLEYLKYCESVCFSKQSFYSYIVNNPNSLSNELPDDYFKNQLYLFEKTLEFFLGYEKTSDNQWVSKLYNDFMKNISNYVRKSAKNHHIISFNKLMKRSLLTEKTKDILNRMNIKNLSRGHKIIYILIQNKHFFSLYVLYRFFK